MIWTVHAPYKQSEIARLPTRFSQTAGITADRLLHGNNPIHRPRSDLTVAWIIRLTAAMMPV